MKSQHAYKKIAKYDNYRMDLSKVYYQKIIKEVTRLCSKGDILDIGCYDGSLGEIFLKMGYRVSGIEAHWEACASAAKKGVAVVKKDLEEGLPWAEDTFNCVIAAEMIEHVYDTDRFLTEIKRVLKKDGIFVISFPNVACFSNRLKLLFNFYPRYCEYRAGASGGHIRVYTLPVMNKQLISHNFGLIRTSGANFPLPMHSSYIPDFLKKIAVWLGEYTPALAGQIVISMRNLK